MIDSIKEKKNNPMVKVFISHSSKDKNIVGLFKDIILKSGIGFKDKNIFYTSSPETGVPIGENIPEYIKRNLLDCDYVFLMISENYKKSEVCLNEMGVAMIIGKKIFPVLLHNYTFDKVGWLIDRTLCVRIDDVERLNEIRDIFYSNNIYTSTSNWNSSRDEFMKQLSCLVKPVEEILPKGLLDYQLEKDKSLKTYNDNIEYLNEKISSCVDKSRILIKEHNASLNAIERKSILVDLAVVLSKLADEIERLTPLIYSSLVNLLNAVEGVLRIRTVPWEEKEIWRNGILDFQNQCKSSYRVLISSRSVFGDMVDMEQNQMKAKYRILKEYDSLMNAFDYFIKKVSEII